MAVDAALRQQVEADILAREGVTARDMMGTQSYVVRGRMFAFWVADGLVARLSDRVRQDFIDERVGVEFQGPQGRGMGDFTRLPLASKDDVENVLRGVTSAYEFVVGTAKARKKGKSKR